MRRRFVEAVDAGDLLAAKPLEWIQDLYQLEAHATDQGMDVAQRAELRQSKAQPILDQIQSWLMDHASRIPPKSPLGDAIGYARNQWEALGRYVHDGALEIDNNRAERLMRMVAVGRKNYLFAGSDAGARAAAVLYTVIATCRLHGIDACAYLADVCAKISAGWPQSQLDAPRSTLPA